MSNYLSNDLYKITIYKLPNNYYFQQDAHKQLIDNLLKEKYFEISKIRAIPIISYDKKSIRKIVYKFAKFFRREFGYDFIQYAEDREDNYKRCIAFLFLHNYGIDTYAIGACVFRNRKYNDYDGWCLQWAWLHPYFRNKGIFSESFPVFKKIFGDFFIEPPLSKHMSYLVSKFYGSYEKMLELTKNK